MADISGIATSGSGLSLLDMLRAERDDAANADSGVSPAVTEARNSIAAATSRKAKSAYGGGIASSIGQAALNRAIAELSRQGDGRLTFQKIRDYQAQLEEEFSASVRSDLPRLGVPATEEFTLNMSPDGTISVDTENQAVKETIEQYLKDNPEICEQFGYIQALANFDRAKQSPASAMWQGLSDFKATIQASAVDAFFSDAMNAGMNYASLMVGFSGQMSGLTEDTSFYTGINYTV